MAACQCSTCCVIIPGLLGGFKCLVWPRGPASILPQGRIEILDFRTTSFCSFLGVFKPIAFPVRLHNMDAVCDPV